MAEANERMRKRSRVLSLLPDMILAMRRDGVITYASENCRQFLKYTREVSKYLARTVHSSLRALGFRSHRTN